MSQIGTILRTNPKIHSMKRLAYPVALVALSLVAAAMITTVLAKTLASYYHDDVRTVDATELASR